MVTAAESSAAIAIDAVDREEEEKGNEAEADADAGKKSTTEGGGRPAEAAVQDESGEGD